ncbi:iron oxidase oxidoreductase [Sulfurimonas lithotrophica]|uniref:Iron oxidase oxidoreductase n=1 Tax=Sulfurimonas lithotrophica TaxID=2590022 RepID=A0A5P8P298_9BACT|nr:iron oxidase oxidoreductase [Sulfurimonas lithotrophica]QFR49786.1 iron oxidase oxidoreductase [Sulfurimonas lithotrophica]
MTRRSFFQYMSLLGITTFSATNLEAKGTKEQYRYIETPKDGKKCSMCMHFIPKKNECRMVKGYISPEGYCEAFYIDPRKK